VGVSCQSNLGKGLGHQITPPRETASCCLWLEVTLVPQEVRVTQLNSP